jgi:hypothetical protein
MGPLTSAPPCMEACDTEPPANGSEPSSDPVPQLPKPVTRKSRVPRRV